MNKVRQRAVDELQPFKAFPHYKFWMEQVDAFIQHSHDHLQNYYSSAVGSAFMIGAIIGAVLGALITYILI